MINGEYGNTLRISAEEDISGNTNSIELRSPSPYVSSRVLTAADGVVLGVTTKTVGGILFTANEYVEYPILQGDINIAGNWNVCLFSLTPGGENKILTNLTFPVGSC